MVVKLGIIMDDRTESFPEDDPLQYVSIECRNGELWLFDVMMMIVTSSRTGDANISRTNPCFRS